MTSTQVSPWSGNSNFIIHSFETSEGSARPVKKPKSNLPEALTTRRPHKKSRNGCTRCKTRRIKCDEQKPSCATCLRRGTPCLYFEASPGPSQSSNIRHSSPSAFPSLTSDTFTMQDMRFFHHFLIKATPSLPIGNEKVWAREIPQFAQYNQYLMHAVLALGASHLSRLVDDDSLQVHALTYRVRSLDGLRRAMLNETWAYGDPDSLIAGSYALMLQSSHMTDGLSDWLRLLRMAISISISASIQQNVITEFDLRPTKHFDTMQPYAHLMPSIDANLLASCLEALESVENDMKDAESQTYVNCLIDAVKAHQMSPMEGYISFGQVFRFWLELTEERFGYCLDPSNGEMQLLLAYFISLLITMLPLGVIENQKTVEWTSSRHLKGMLGWGKNTCDNVPAALYKHVKFPRYVFATAIAECEDRPFSGPPVLQLDVAAKLVRQLKELSLKGG